jgi:hypothetical protein
MVRPVRMTVRAGTLARQPVEIRRLHHRIARAAQRVEALLVRDDKQQINRPLCRLGR